MTDSERRGWRCFHCDFETTDEQEAAAHFGEDMGEQAICLLWSQISKEDKLREYQDTLRELEGERRNNSVLRAQNETLEYQRDMFSEELIRYFGPDCTSLWVAGDRYNNALFALKLEEEKLEGGEAMTKPADSDQIAKPVNEAAAREAWPKWWTETQRMRVPKFDYALENAIPPIRAIEFAATFAASERQAVIEDCAKMADQIAKSCSACSYSRKKHGEEPSFCENFGCSSFADLAAAIRSME